MVADEVVVELERRRKRKQWWIYGGYFEMYGIPEELRRQVVLCWAILVTSFPRSANAEAYTAHRDILSELASIEDPYNPTPKSTFASPNDAQATPGATSSSSSSTTTSPQSIQPPTEVAASEYYYRQLNEMMVGDDPWGQLLGISPNVQKLAPIMTWDTNAQCEATDVNSEVCEGITAFQKLGRSGLDGTNSLPPTFVSGSSHENVTPSIANSYQRPLDVEAEAMNMLQAPADVMCVTLALTLISFHWHYSSG